MSPQEREKKIKNKEMVRIMIVKMIKNLENQMEKMKESLNKDLEVKNKHTQTNNTITEIKILWKESIAKYLKQKNESMSWKIKWWK